MRTVGKITNKTMYAQGRRYSVVKLWVNGKWGSWGLANKNHIPRKHPLFGVFEIDPSDIYVSNAYQFCYWIDPNKS